MNAKEMAARLNGREYTAETTKDDCEIAKAAGLVIAYGASDDLLELEGAVVDELGAYDGTVRFIDIEKAVVMPAEDDDAFCERCQAKVEKIQVTADWSPKDLKETSWKITADVPFESFDIMEDGILYCRGCVFELKAGTV